MSGKRQVIVTLGAGATRAGPKPRQDGRSAEVPHLPQHAPPGLRRLPEVPFFTEHSLPLFGHNFPILAFQKNISDGCSTVVPSHFSL